MKSRVIRFVTSRKLRILATMSFSCQVPRHVCNRGTGSEPETQQDRLCVTIQQCVCECVCECVCVCE